MVDMVVMVVVVGNLIKYLSVISLQLSALTIRGGGVWRYLRYRLGETSFLQAPCRGGRGSVVFCQHGGVLDG